MSVAVMNGRDDMQNQPLSLVGGSRLLDRHTDIILPLLRLAGYEGIEELRVDSGHDTICDDVLSLIFNTPPANIRQLVPPRFVPLRELTVSESGTCHYLSHVVDISLSPDVVIPLLAALPQLISAQVNVDVKSADHHITLNDIEFGGGEHVKHSKLRDLSLHYEGGDMSFYRSFENLSRMTNDLTLPALQSLSFTTLGSKHCDINARAAFISSLAGLLTRADSSLLRFTTECIPLDGSLLTSPLRIMPNLTDCQVREPLSTNTCDNDELESSWTADNGNITITPYFVQALTTKYYGLIGISNWSTIFYSGGLTRE
uniref:Uncharacterized protein n=1 Tax=Moniliophthora roreri TaxID=221103 RepID=A0A0W0FAA2_MONRR